MNKTIRAQVIKAGFELRDCVSVRRPLNEDTSDFNYVLVHSSQPQITYIKPSLNSIWFTFDDGTYKEYLDVVLGYGCSEERAWNNAEMNWGYYTKDEIMSLVRSNDN